METSGATGQEMWIYMETHMAINLMKYGTSNKR